MDPDAIELLERREALLRQGPSAALDEATEALRERLAGSDAVVRRVTLDEPGDLLDRLAAGESIHPVRDRDDLADRLDEDRRCYVLEHPELPQRPSNVVWVALTRGVAGDIAELLDPSAATGDPGAADTAVFYSIWSVEPGLVGFPGGRDLLTGAVAELRCELPGLGTFVTLSPIPGFREWWSAHHGDGAATSVEDHELLAGCASYLTSFDERGRPLDPVARFHLRNGARLWALHRHGDTSDRGAARSFGIMANYRYEPEDRERNRHQLDSGRVTLGPVVERLLVAERPRASR